ncbi:MAG: 4'-phosphopantetheinyl transferase superfamily protein [Thermoanaerobaculia bacterium]|nr:4'-phosphopantetheinyl transferase superfamily protein [Thermoanaerobaculia bacterium]
MGASPQLPEDPPRVDADIATPILVRGDVQIWRIPLARPASMRRRLASTLSTAEQARAARFHFERHRRRFAVAHGGLRVVLAGYLQRAPEALHFAAASGGKPFLERESNDADLRFNLSHSSDLALLAVTLGREVGIDVERLNPKAETTRLARRFFAPEERDALEHSGSDQHVADFFRVWTLKEAYLKAVGTGLGRSLSSFAVAPRGTDPRLLRSDAGDEEDWLFECLEVAPENGQSFAGALVASTRLRS